VKAVFLALVIGGLIVGLLRLTITRIEPRMAFFPMTGEDETPGDLGIDYEPVTLRTSDGERVHAWWLPHEKPLARAVFLHGNGGNLSVWLRVIAGIYRAGIAVYALDYRGYGLSTGNPTEKGLYRDVDALIDDFWRSRHAAGAPAIYWGRSLGGSMAAYAASRRPPDAVILESPFPDALSLISHYPHLRALSWLSTYRFPTVKFLRDYSGPLLIVHGDRDTVVPHSEGRRVFDRLGGAKEFVTIPGADHNDLHLVNPAAYWDAILRFVRKTAG
jgi:fermentation-respiration switch protein FrsA (DUF1100 family)